MTLKTVPAPCVNALACDAEVPRRYRTANQYIKQHIIIKSIIAVTAFVENPTDACSSVKLHDLLWQV
jgi:hypothetical protein